MNARSLATFLGLSLALAACDCGTRGNGNGNPIPTDDASMMDGGGGFDAAPDVMTDTMTFDTNPPDVIDRPPAQGCQKMDVLFIIDDSGSMEEEQGNLVRNFDNFIRVLDNYRVDGALPLDYRIGVTTTGPVAQHTITLELPFGAPMMINNSYDGDDGRLRNESSCGMTRPWIERTDMGAQMTFECVAEVGTSGPGLEMPLYNLEKAITTRVADGSNAGFLREDAVLAVVIITDEDDCSNTSPNIMETISLGGSPEDSCGDPETLLPVSRLLENLDLVKGSRQRWAAHIIAGETSCTSDLGDAVEGRRLKEFQQAAGGNVGFSSICSGDLEEGLETAVDAFARACDDFPPLE